MNQKNKQLQKVQSDVQATEQELEETRSALSSMGDQLVSIQDAYAEAEQKLVNSNAEVGRLEQVRYTIGKPCTRSTINYETIRRWYQSCA